MYTENSVKDDSELVWTFFKHYIFYLLSNKGPAPIFFIFQSHCNFDTI